MITDGMFLLDEDLDWILENMTGTQASPTFDSRCDTMYITRNASNSTAIRIRGMPHISKIAEIRCTDKEMNRFFKKYGHINILLTDEQSHTIIDIFRMLEL